MYNSFSCFDATFIFHNDYDQIYILCTTQNTEHMTICSQTGIYFYSSNIDKAIVNCTAPSYNQYPICSTMDINSLMVNNFTMICMKDNACLDININPKYNAINTTYILCNTQDDLIM